MGTLHRVVDIHLTTTSRHPDELYINGIQRSSFIPAIDLIKDRFQVVDLNSGTGTCQTIFLNFRPVACLPSSRLQEATPRSLPHVLPPAGPFHQSRAQKALQVILLVRSYFLGSGIRPKAAIMGSSARRPRIIRLGGQVQIRGSLR